jgi:hypothetical protein
VRKLIGVVLVLGLSACHGGVAHQAPAPGVPGATSARDAVAAFLAGVNAGDLQAMSAVWGTPTGLARDDIPLKDLEEREAITIKCLKNDKYVVNSEASGPEGRRILNVALTRGNLTRIADFTAVAGPKGRWFFEKVDLGTLMDLCKAK